MLLVNLFLVCLAIGLGAANELKETQDNWVLDKLNDSSVYISGSKLAVNYPVRSKYPAPHFNALYQGIVANEKHKRYYWEFTCVKNCYSVGVAKKDKYFLDGHSIKGGKAGEHTCCFITFENFLFVTLVRFVTINNFCCFLQKRPR